MNKATVSAAVSPSSVMAALVVLTFECASPVTFAEPDLEQPISAQRPAALHLQLTANQTALSSANNGFGFRLLQQVSSENSGANVFISPYSASTALQMVSFGAAGQTLTQMQQALGVSFIEPSDLAKANKATAAIIDARNANFTLTTANSIWCKSGFRVESEFVKTNEAYFGARIESVNFQNPTAANAINEWASAETHGKVKNIVSPPIDASVRLILANAVYFLGNWQTAFNAKQTQSLPFYKQDGSEVQAMTMSQTGTFNYIAKDGFQGIELPYKGGDLAMFVVLPGAGTNVQDFVNMLSGAWWEESLLASMQAAEGTISLPRFTMSFSTEFNQALTAMGMSDAFVRDVADFRGITTTETLYISAVTQKAYVEVDEKGTEAAAVTTVTIVHPSIAPPPVNPFVMDCNRPFVFFIEDLQAQTILFSGIVHDPTASN